MRIIYFCLFIIVLFGCRTKKIQEPETLGVEFKAIPFKLNKVELLESPFKRAMELNAEWLISLNPDRLLYRYRKNAGLAPRDSSYGGWEVMFTGHTLGHYLSACAMMHASTGDENMKNRVDYIIEELEICQKANDSGYVGGVRYGGRIFDEIRNGDIRLEYNGFKLNDCWVPWYNIHKLLAGLIDAYQYTGSRKAYQILLRMTDWVDDVVSGLTDHQVQKMLQSEHGGINESLATVYYLTGKKKYFDLAKRFNHQEILNPLIQKKDELDGKHANSQIPKVIGVLKQFEVSGDSLFFRMADFFWNTIVNHHTYVIGGNAESEYLGPPDHLHDRITDFTCENCGTYNMLKLTEGLFCLNPSVNKVDYYERALYNQILASQNPSNGTVTYFEGMAVGSSRKYCSPDESFWCCTGTGFENHSKYGKAIYYHDHKDGLYINLFIPSILNWDEKNVKITQNTKYPFSSNSSFQFQMDKPKKINVKLRYPTWAKNGIFITINSKTVKTFALPGTYIELDRIWKDGDELKVQLPMSVYTENILGNNSVIAYLYGPVVLAADLGYGIPESQIPLLVGNIKNDAGLPKLIDRESLKLRMKTISKEVELIPYFLTGEKSTAVYFYQIEKADLEADSTYASCNRFENKIIEGKTTDRIVLGNKKQEFEHELKSRNSNLGIFEERSFRSAENGWFSFKMKVSEDKPMGLLCTIWGNSSTTENFDVYVDGEFLTNIAVRNWGDSFVRKYYTMHLDYTLGKEEVTVTFRSKKNHSIGSVFDCRMLVQL